MFVIPKSFYSVRKTRGRIPTDKGRSVFAKKDIPAGSVIGDYQGKVVRPDSEDEVRDGLYTMWCNAKCDILANPKVEGMHFLNHSCANNCDVFPYKGHMIVFAARHIYKGEELTIDYSLTPCEDKKIPCVFHACSCDRRICTGTMHASAGANPEAWEKFVKQKQGKYYRKLPAPFGKNVPSLAKYPKLVGLYSIYNIFGTEKHPPAVFRDRSLPKIAELSKRIRETGRQLRFPNLHFQVYGIRDGVVLGMRV